MDTVGSRSIPRKRTAWCRSSRTSGPCRGDSPAGFTGRRPRRHLPGRRAGGDRRKPGRDPRSSHGRRPVVSSRFATFLDQRGEPGMATP